jgi:hypothetical protein
MLNREINTPRDAIAASLASAWLANSSSYFLLHPMNTAINRLRMNQSQISSYADYKKAIFMQTYNQNTSAKIKSMFSGTLSAITYKVLTRSMKYITQPIIAEHIEHHLSSTASYYFGPLHGLALMQAMAGGVVGAIEVAAFHPLNTLKTKRQAVDSRSLSLLWQTERIAIFYNGFGMAFAKAIPAAFVLFGTNQGVMSYYGITNQADADFKHQFSAAAAGVFVGSLVTNPQDVIMTRAQTHKIPVSSVSIFKTILRDEGIKGFYRGVILNSLLSLPKKAAPFALYGFFMNTWRDYENNREQNQNNTPRKS